MAQNPELGSFRTIISAKCFFIQAAFEYHVISAVGDANDYHEFLVIDIPSAWGERLFDLVDDKFKSRKSYNTKTSTLRIQVMPTEIQNSVQAWVDKQIFRLYLEKKISLDERKSIQPEVGTTLKFSSGPYSSSRKEPDLFIRVSDHYLPHVVFESGWSESMSAIDNDIKLLLLGGNGHIKVVILLKWRRVQNVYVSGVVELYKRDRTGTPTLEQQEIVFPRPANGNTQQLKISRRELFGSAVLPGCNGRDILVLDIEALRGHARTRLGFMGLQPCDGED